MGKYAGRNKEGHHRIEDNDPKSVRVLKEEHHAFRELFDKAEKTEGKALLPLAREICMRLTVHMTIEEELFYPAAKQVGDADEVDEGIVEHGAAKDLIAEIEQLNGDEELFPSKVHVLGEQTMHHVDEEDEELFEEVKKAKSGKVDFDAIGDQLCARRQELYDEIAQTGETGPTHEAQVEEVPSVK